MAMRRPRQPRRRTRPPTIWRCPDDLWNDVIQPIVDQYDPPAPTGRPRIDQRDALDGIIYHLRTGCQWNALPRLFGDDSSVHRTFQRWVDREIFDRILIELILRCDELGEIEWQWQSADGSMVKARKGGTTSAGIPPIAARTARSAAC